MIFVIIIKHAKFFAVRSSLNYFPAHQPAVTNSMHLQYTYTSHLQHLVPPKIKTIFLKKQNYQCKAYLK